MKTRPLRIVLVAGPKDHGPGEHDYPAFQKAWTELLGSADRTEVVKAWEWPAAEEFTKADVMIFYQHGDWNAKQAAEVDAFLQRGGGLVYIHWAIDGRNEGPAFAQRIGLAGQNTVGFRHGDINLMMHERTKHPVLRNMSKLDLTDETYWKMTGDLKPDRVLASAIEDKEPRPRCGRWSRVVAECSSRFRGTIRIRSMIRCSASCCYEVSPGLRVNRWIGSMNWFGQGLISPSESVAFQLLLEPAL